MLSYAGALIAGPIYDIGMRPDPSTGPIFNVMSWNVAGLRALLKKVGNGFRVYALDPYWGSNPVCVCT